MDDNGEQPYMKALRINRQQQYPTATVSPVHYTLEEMQRHPSYVEPDMKLTTMEATVALEKYLVDLHCQLWPRGQWTITNVERREDAIDWFIEVCQKIGLIEHHPVQQAIVQEQIVPLRIVQENEQ